MRATEHYTPHLTVVAGLTLAVLASFQIYLFREPGRIQDNITQDKAAAVTAGEKLFANNCAPCHGSEGEGDIGPALNDKQFLATASDATVFSIISSGIPGSQMPAWNQSHGGPFTDENVNQLVTFIRNWEPKAPDRQATPVTGDAVKGATIFANVCSVCHGDNGVGTSRAPALNDATRLNQLDDAWYTKTITEGRLAQGMPTWGTVLSPAQIADLVALIDTWRGSAAPSVGSGTPAPGPAETIARPSNSGGPGAAVNLTGDVQNGAQVFTQNCQKCHGDQGIGGVTNPGSSDGTIPPLNPIDSTLTSVDSKVFAYNLDLFIEHGSTPEGPNPKQNMLAWGDDKKLTAQQIADVISYLISLNPVQTTGAADVARPSNAGGPGSAVGLTGVAATGGQLFVTNCQKCHGEQGVGGVANPGSDDGTVPPLNPIDSTLIDKNPLAYATNLDLFIEHGSTPAGPNPQQKMPAWGDEKKLNAQQIADLIAYLMSLNPVK